MGHGRENNRLLAASPHGVKHAFLNASLVSGRFQGVPPAAIGRTLGGPNRLVIFSSMNLRERGIARFANKVHSLKFLITDTATYF